ncbi:MAG: GntR family transcriptional regulator [Phenylobacterium sp.]|uniref:aminotransferase-like domain-containing protein n=1 Tax=Phenylobacterium sp. TaxID=1871053 RepID=UPI0025EE46AE|nr:PLP-dependent aminotransferase family protein [Phenylobacterium sp.]MBA4010852.1 GntR family transcriptional regulator [Phenylobacterium sp.]
MTFESGGTRVDQVMAAIRQRIAGRALQPGAKAPSIRAFAVAMGVSKSTVVEAYDRLAAEGVIQARRGSGFYVAGRTPPLALAELGPRLDRSIDPLWVSRQSLETWPDALKPGCGWLPTDWMPQDAVRRALRSLARSERANLTDYGPPLGLPALRQHLSRRLAEHGVEAPPGQIMLAESGTQAIDLVCRFLLEPGDTVMVDDPCYFNFHAMLRAHRVQVVGAPWTASGPDLEAFELALIEHRPRLYITNSGPQNPTGAILTPVVAHRLLKLAERHGVTIVEDDIYADLEIEPAPRLAAFDGLDRVVHIGSFSKTLSAAARCGFIAARADWIEGLVDLKVATSFGGGQLAAELTLAILTDGGYRRYLASLRERLARARGETLRRLRTMGLEPWIEPQAGMFLWMALPEGVDAARLAQRALSDGVVLAPGDAFSLSQSARGYMRFNVAQCADGRVYEALERAMRA